MSKIEGVMYKCDKCGESKFLSCENIAKEGGIFALGVYKLSAGKNNMHLCEKCYLQLCSWFDEKSIHCISICGYCKYGDKDEDDYPCTECKHNHVEKFEPKGK